MAIILAWINVVLLAVLIMQWIALKLLKRRGREAADSLKEAVKLLRRVHKPTGMLLLVSGIAHGYLASGARLPLNSNGFLLWAFLLMTGVVGTIYEHTRNARVRKAHLMY